MLPVHLLFAGRGSDSECPCCCAQEQLQVELQSLLDTLDLLASNLEVCASHTVVDHMLFMLIELLGFCESAYVCGPAHVDRGVCVFVRHHYHIVADAVNFWCMFCSPLSLCVSVVIFLLCCDHRFVLLS